MRAAGSESDIPSKSFATQPFPTVVPPFSRQGMPVKIITNAFMTDEQKVGGKPLPVRARTGVTPPPRGVGGTILRMPAVNGGALFFASPRPGEWHGVRGRETMPSILKVFGLNPRFQRGRPDSRRRAGMPRAETRWRWRLLMRQRTPRARFVSISSLPASVMAPI